MHPTAVYRNLEQDKRIQSLTWALVLTLFFRCQCHFYQVFLAGKLSLQQKRKKTPFFAWDENWWRLNVKTPISFTHAQERSAKLRFRDLVMLAMRKCACSWIVTLKPTLDPYHLGKARIEFCYK